MVDGKASMDGIWKALGMVLLDSNLAEVDSGEANMQEMAGEINKIRRALFP